MGSGGARKQISLLSETQREVLRRIADGETNYAIATALGMTLDGAKYHVSEILAKLGVDSREEAAEAWRSGQRVPSARLARLFALPAAQWVAGAAAGVAVLGMGLWLVTSLAGDDESDEFEGLQVAYLAGDDTEASADRTIVIADTGGAERTLSPARPYASVELSPTGHRLAAIEVSDAVNVRIFELVSGRSEVLDFDEESAIWLAWSPDGRYIGVLTEGHMRIHRADGATVAARPFTGGVSGHAGAPILWSPDSQLAAFAFGEQLAVLSADGSNFEVTRPPGVEPSRLYLGEWQPPRTLVVGDTGQPLTRVAAMAGWSANVRDSTPAWTSLTYEPKVFADQLRFEEAQAVVPGMQLLGHGCPTADLHGTAWTFTSDRVALHLTLIVLVDGVFHRFDLPQPASGPIVRTRPCLSVLVRD